MYQIPKIPKDKDFEHYVSAYAQLSGLFLERGIIYRINGEGTTEEMLELYIVGSRYDGQDKPERVIIEIKSGNWGYHDIFKVVGWMKYLRIDNGIFVVQKVNGKGMDVARNESRKLSVELLTDEKIEGNELIQYFHLDESKAWFRHAVKSLRYSFTIEQEMLDYAKSYKKANPSRNGATILWDYLFDISNNSFFCTDAVARDLRLFNLFIKNKNLTARLSHEKVGEELPDGDFCERIDPGVYRKIFNEDANKNIYHVSLYAELLNRLLVLKSTIEYVIYGRRESDGSTLDFLAFIDEISLSANIKNAALQFKSEPYSYLYPSFWQLFVYLFGGFLMRDKLDEEKKLLSEITGIPIEEIDNALSAFDLLFPINGKKWMIEGNKHSHINYISLLPLPIRGIGVNFRRWIYLGENSKVEDLGKIYSGFYTMRDLLRWNNTCCEFLSKYEVKREK